MKIAKNVGRFVLFLRREILLFFCGGWETKHHTTLLINLDYIVKYSFLRVKNDRASFCDVV